MAKRVAKIRLNIAKNIKMISVAFKNILTHDN